MNTETTQVAGVSTDRLVRAILFLGLMSAFMVMYSA